MKTLSTLIAASIVAIALGSSVALADDAMKSGDAMKSADSMKAECMKKADMETGFSHLWHAGCCIVFLIAFEIRGTGTDDRPATLEQERKDKSWAVAANKSSST